jgi:hypothetical protein
MTTPAAVEVQRWSETLVDVVRFREVVQACLEEGLLCSGQTFERIRVVVRVAGDRPRPRIYGRNILFQKRTVPSMPVGSFVIP